MNGTGGSVEVLSPVESLEYLRAHPDAWLLDVREPGEYARAHLAGSRLVPLGTLPEALDGADRAQDILFYCASGGRSAQALDWATEEGFTNVKHLRGGIGGWLQAGLPVEE